MKPLLFREEDNSVAEEFKEYLPVNLNLRFETIAPYLAIAEKKYVISLIGQPLMDDLVSYYDADTFASMADGEKMGELLHKVRFAVIRLALWCGFDAISTQMSDTGFASAIDKENRLFRYQEENLKTSFRREGFDALDDMLEYLDANASEFEHYADSPAYKNCDKSLIKTTEMFDGCYNIERSRIVFLKMRQYVRDVELLRLQHRIGAAFYNELLTADESVARYAAILPNIRRFVVYQSIAEGIGELHKVPTEKGLVFEENKTDGVEVKPLEHAQMMETRIQFAEKAEKYLAAAITHIQSNKSDYPNYTQFAGNSPADGIIHRDNTNKKTFLA